jgi:hypothetical protein
VEIRRLEFWPANVAKLRVHGISQAEVQSMVALDDWGIGGHDDYPVQIRVTGPTAAGRLITVAMDPSDDPTVWRRCPASGWAPAGWDAEPAERAYYWEQHP